MFFRRAAVLALLIIALSSAAVFSAQEAGKPPSWVGIYTTAGKAGLKWTAVAGAARYQVYRSIASGRSRELAATTTDVSYIDAGVRPGETYYYVLKAVFPDGKESGFSEERYIKMPTATAGETVVAPDWVSLTLEEKDIKLSWNPVGSTGVMAYNVYKSTDREKGFQLVGSTQDTNLTDPDLVEGKTYYYALTTLDREFKETKFGAVREIAFVHPKGTPDKTIPRRGEEEEQLPDRLAAKPTRIIGFILKGKDDKPLSSPTDVAVGPDGRLYITDSGTARIQIFKPSGEFIKDMGGYGKEEGQFEKINGVALDAEQHIIAVDAFRGKIQKFDSQGRLLMSKKMFEDGKEIAEDLGLKQPVETFGVVKIVVAPDGNLYVIDNFNNCIEIYTPNGKYIRTFGGKGIKEGKLLAPTFAAFGPDGNLYVSDCLNARIQIFDKDGKFLWKFGSYGNVAGTFGRPKGIAFDDKERIYVADSMMNVVQVFDKNGRFLFVLADERGKQMDLGTPQGIVVDNKKRIYMVEKLINRLQIRQVSE